MNPLDTSLILTPSEKVSPAWIKTMRNVEVQLDCARLALEGSKDVDDTNVLRGRIRAYRWILSLHDDRPVLID